jgi:hypothetical protein
MHWTIYNNVMGPVKRIKEYVVNEDDSMRQIVRVASYGLNRNLSMLLYYLGNDINSNDILESKDTSNFFFQYKFVVGRKRLKNEMRINGEGGRITSKKVSKRNSLFKLRQPKIIAKNKRKGLVTQYQLLNKNCSWGPETIFCEYDNFNRKIKEVVQDSTGKIIIINKIEYLDSEIIVMSHLTHQKKKTIYKLDAMGNWIEKTIRYPNYAIYGVYRKKRIISYY